MKALFFAFLFMIVSGCTEKSAPQIINAPENTEVLNTRVEKLSKEIPFLDYSKLPEPVGYAKSGIEDLVLLGPGLRVKFTELRGRFGKNMEVKVLEKATCTYEECPKRYKVEPRINSIVYKVPTHLVEYSSNGELLVRLRVRYSPYYSKFHIMGYFSP